MKLKALRQIKAKAAFADIRGLTIPAGTNIFVMKELEPAPFGDHHRILIVRIDNGTGVLGLMPETCIRDTEVPQ